MQQCFFVEGLCEKEFVTWFIRKEFPSVVIVEDPVTFKEESYSKDICYIEDCDGGSNIPYRLEARYHFIKRSNTEKIIIVGDTERLYCPIARRSKILDSLSLEIPQDSLSFVFFIPTIEEIYCNTVETTEKVLRKLCKKEAHELLNLEVLESNKSPIDKMKKLFIDNQSPKITARYPKAEFAKTFFSQFDYLNSQNESVKRFISFIQNN